MSHSNISKGIWISLLLIVSPAVNAAGRDTYLLGPQDKIEIRVNDIRAGSGDAHAWSSFDGEFYVNPEGQLSLPLVGEINATGKTTAEISSLVANSVKNEVGLAQLPKVSIQIIKFRPFYIMGAVEKPGDYEFRPGLTILQAVSIAGGLLRQSTATILGYQKDALTQLGESKTLETEKLSLAIRLARLDSDAAGSDRINLPGNMNSQYNTPEAQKILSDETLTLVSQRSGLKAQRTAIERQQESLKSEISTLDNKEKTVSKQLELSNNDLEQVRSLANRGLTITTRQLAAEQNVAAYQGTLLDVQLASIRAKEALSRSARDLLEVEQKHKDDISREAGDLRLRIALIAKKIDANSQLLNHSSSILNTQEKEFSDISLVRYLLTTRIGDETQTRYVSASEMLHPGDVLRVEVNSSSGVSGSPLNQSAEK
ncbi:polysaccharide export protein [Methylobacterium sp. J-001]|uniref:polysaccharide biosynthesis/export family protein n=1 Tax=Methylobacterium sp. J-001 TaxID=2836609 RepID=UPI001FBA4228|nr:polysaccharide biosynthesis/export family protein [Methylobacterium sp. J-001]MCJ2115666.1 polysaccharide export protein [Methylobacterium sp. J-001]